VTTLLTGKGFTYLILGLYLARCLSYCWGGSYGRALYWLCAIGITVSAEFLIARWP
jgi:hypothetical protein